MSKYEIIIYWSEEDGAFIAEVPELAGCLADGATYREALANAEIIIDEWIETATDLGRQIPEPKGRLVLAQLEMTLLEKIKVNLDYLFGKADSSLYAADTKNPNLTLTDWQKRWEIFSSNGCGFVWYGVDEAGNIAEFASERTDVPEVFFQDVSASKKAEEFFDNLPEVTKSILPENLRYELKESAKRLQGEKSFWKKGANKGFFIFDELEIPGFKNNAGKNFYELMLIPETPLKITNLPSDIQDLLKPYRIENLNFKDCQFLDISKYFYCKE